MGRQIRYVWQNSVVRSNRCRRDERLAPPNLIGWRDRAMRVVTVVTRTPRGAVLTRQRTWFVRTFRAIPHKPNDALDAFVRFAALIPCASNIWTGFRSFAAFRAKRMRGA